MNAEEKKLVVSVIVPCRNESRHIDEFLRSVIAQDLGRDLECEIVIADGMSDDGTREILQQWQARLPNLAVIDNPRRYVSPGLNAALRIAKGEIIVRMDAHSNFAPDYIQQCVRTLIQTGAQNVGGPAIAVGRAYMEQAICVAYQSKFACGGALFHDPAYEGFVDTVTYGCWRKSTLESLGGFDEELVRNQDDELNLRLIRSGGKIWQTPRIQHLYHPRSSLLAVARQYGQYGYWKPRVIHKHGTPASWRHLVPGTFAAVLLVTAATSPFWVVSRYLFILALLAYGVAVIAASLATCGTASRIKFLPVMPLVFAAYQLPYGFGFLKGMIDVAAQRKPPSKATAVVR